MDKAAHTAAEASLDNVTRPEDIDLVQSLSLIPQDRDIGRRVVDQIGTSKGTSQRALVRQITPGYLHIQPVERPFIMMNQGANLLSARTQRTHQSRAQMSSGTGHNDDSHCPTHSYIEFA
jgi:hypothetical protein